MAANASALGVAQCICGLQCKPSCDGEPHLVRTLAEPASLRSSLVVKPWDSPGGRGEINGLYTYPGGRIVCNGCTLESLIMQAFDVQSFQISGGPGG